MAPTAWLHHHAQRLLAAPLVYTALLPIVGSLADGVARDWPRAWAVPMAATLLVAPLCGFFLWARLHPRSRGVRIAAARLCYPLCLLYVVGGALGTYRIVEDLGGQAGARTLAYGVLTIVSGMFGLAGLLGHYHDDWHEPAPTALALTPESRGLPVPSSDRLVVWKPGVWAWLGAPFGLLGGGFLVFGAGSLALETLMGALVAGGMGAVLFLGGLSCLAWRSAEVDAREGRFRIAWRLGPLPLRPRSLPLAAITGIAVRHHQQPGLGTVHRVVLEAGDAELEVIGRLQDGGRARALAHALQVFLARASRD